MTPAGAPAATEGTATRLRGTALALTGAAIGTYIVSICTPLIVARSLGATSETDALSFAGAVPQFLGNVLGPATSTVLVISLARLRGKGDEDLLRGFYSIAVLILLTCSAVLTLAYWAGCGVLLRLIFGNAAAATLRTATSLTPLYFVQFCLAMLTNLQLASWNARKRFLLPSLVQIAGAVASLALIVPCLRLFGIGGPIAARTATSLLVCAVLWRPIRVVRRVDPELRAALVSNGALIAATMVQAFLVKVPFLVERRFAAGLGEGYAYKVLLASTAAVTFMAIQSSGYRRVTSIALSEAFARGDKAAVRSTLREALSEVCRLLPVSLAAMYLLAAPGLRLLLGSRHWSAADIGELARLFHAYLPALGAWSVINVLAMSILQAQQRQWLLAFVMAPVVVCHYAAGAVLSRLLGAPGIGLAMSLATAAWGVPAMWIACRSVDLRVGRALRATLPMLLPGVAGLVTAILWSRAFAGNFGGQIPLVPAIGGVVASWLVVKGSEMLRRAPLPRPAEA